MIWNLRMCTGMDWIWVSLVSKSPFLNTVFWFQNFGETCSVTRLKVVETSPLFKRKQGYHSHVDFLRRADLLIAAVFLCKFP